MPATLGPVQALGGGIACMALMLLTGVTGPLVDQLFLRSPMNRQQIVATKASCQVFGHGLKLLYFGALIEQAGSVEPWVLVMAVGASMLGTSLGKQILERLSDAPVPHLGGTAHHRAGHSTMSATAWCCWRGLPKMARGHSSRLSRTH